MTVSRNAMQSTPAAAPLDRRDLWVAALGALAAGCLFALAFQTRMYGDGPGLVGFYFLGVGQGYYHVLFLRLCWAMEAIVSPADPRTLPELVTLFGAASACGASYIMGRAFDASRGQALFGAAMIGAAPGFAFFATTVEVPALEAGCVGIVSCVAVLAPWKRWPLALCLLALCFPLVFFAHQSGLLLGPGFVALAGYARARKGSSFSPGWLILIVGPVLLASLLLAMATTSWLRGLGFHLEFKRELGMIDVFTDSYSTGHFLWSGLLRPLALCTPLALIGIWRLRGEGARLAPLALLIAFPLLFFAWWGVPERGGYMVGLAPLLAPLVARGSVGSPAVLAALIVPQLALSWQSIGEYDRGFDPLERVRQADLVFVESGTIVTGCNNAPTIKAWMPGVEEVSLLSWIRPALDHDMEPDEMASILLEQLNGQLEDGPVVLDLSWMRIPPTRVVDAGRPYWDALLAGVEQQYETRRHEHDYWPMLEVVGLRR